MTIIKLAFRLRLRRPVSLTWAIALLMIAIPAGIGHAQTASPVAGDGAPFDPAAFNLALEPVASGFERPVDLVDAGDGSGRLFVVEQVGRVRILRDGVVDTAPFIDLTDRVGCCGERGLLSLVFHPRYAETGFFFVDYTDLNGDTQIVRFAVAPDSPDRADLASATTILTVPQPASNHNGGRLVFGPDGYLYLSLGDGGGGNGQNGQAMDTLLGKLLRLDVDRQENGLPYAVPSDNPFVGTTGARPEIWALGLRNPWRFDFDRTTGDIWIGDVGSALYEEINFLPSGTSGQNFGWNQMEGYECRGDAATACDGFTAPVSGFDRDAGCVVTGGTVYRGVAVPSLNGVYLFADYCGAGIWGLGRDQGGNWVSAGPVAAGPRIVSFGQDAAGELYVVELGGEIFRITAA